MQQKHSYGLNAHMENPLKMCHARDYMDSFDHWKQHYLNLEFCGSGENLALLRKTKRSLYFRGKNLEKIN